MACTGCVSMCRCMCSTPDVYYTAILTCESYTDWPGCPTCRMCPSFSCCCAYSSHVQAHQAAREAQSHYDELADLLETIERLLKPLDIYTQITPTPVMDEIMV